MTSKGQTFLFLYSYYDSTSPVTCSNFTCDIKPQYLLIVENYPHLIRNGMCASQKTVSIKMRLNFCSANLTLIDPLRMLAKTCLLYTSPSPRDRQKSRMPSSA